MNDSVLIMMATYNSERYIGEQITSIQSQTYTNWTLLIQDDSSTDKTRDIIRNFGQNDSRIRLLINDSDIHGPFINFQILLQKCKKHYSADLYMFADHDDIWDSNKIYEMVSFYNKMSKNYSDSIDCPTLIYGDMRVVDGMGKLTAKSLDSKTGIHFKNKMTTFFAHKVYGCNTLFNDSLIKEVPNFNLNDKNLRTLSHDNMLTKLAALNGQIGYISVPLMSYRRYGGNVTAKQTYSFSLRRIVRRLLKVQSLAKDHALTYKQTLFLLEYLKENGQKQALLQEIEDEINSGGFRMVWYLIKNKVSWGKWLKTFSHFLIIISGQYKKYL